MASPRRKVKAFQLPHRDVIDLAALGETAPFVSFFTQCRDRETALAEDGTEPEEVLPRRGLPGPVATAVVKEANAQRDIAALEDDDVVSVLTASGATRDDVLLYRGSWGQTALLEAARHGHTRLCALLLENGAEVNAADTNGATPLYTAAVGGHQDTVELLLRCGADVLAVRRHPFPELPLGAAQRMQHARIEIALDTATRTAAGPFDVMAAAAQGHVPSLLLHLNDVAAGAAPQLEARTPAGDTPLHVALSAEGFDARHELFATLLLEARVAVDVPDGRGRSPLMLAAEQGQQAVVTKLLAAGADPCRTAEPEEEGGDPLTTASFAADAVTQAMLTEAAARAVFEAEHARRDTVAFDDRPAYVEGVLKLRREWLAAGKALEAARLSDDA